MSDFAQDLIDDGWLDGHAPEGTRAERVKYRTEDGEWQFFHRPESDDEPVKEFWAVYGGMNGTRLYYNIDSEAEAESLRRIFIDQTYGKLPPTRTWVEKQSGMY